MEKGIEERQLAKTQQIGEGFVHGFTLYLRVKGAIINEGMVKKLSVLMAKLKETSEAKVFRRGFKKAVELLNKGKDGGIFAWAPSLNEWLKDPDYIFWLGACGKDERRTDTD